ncbi:Hedgehog signalling/DD-peptidase zinc-binding domain,Hedgehog protein, Hint domain,Intein N-terminal [Cinara cedri]|uniref:Hedgehog protein n=2 Tax=Aphididae TaxID=27482 RepID=A0A5E4MDS5_9HEMI|nr:Hedgehog signalling/DD-peptidase zinc-binding domain,Hedgehog protein, Hint domain,Intein N-terminal [Cinara cedri]
MRKGGGSGGVGVVAAVASSSYRWRFTLTLMVCILTVAGGGGSVEGCGPLRGPSKFRNPRKMKPLVFQQHEPNVSENSITASGPLEGRVQRNDSRFMELVPNYNADIEFKDDEGTGADRLMTQRCKEKLNTLAISVMNLWPHVRLRVIDGWVDRAGSSLHNEGRAVDITTSDRDKSKYGMLARLAVEAGFDWVNYNRRYIHCSCKSETKINTRTMGCFPGESVVTTGTGEKKLMKNLRVGESVLALSDDGQLRPSKVLLFLDRSETARTEYVTLVTDTGKSITATPTHLVLRWEKPERSQIRNANPVYAKRVRVNDTLLTVVRDNDGRPRRLNTERVVAVRHTQRNGLYAPLTVDGTLVVDDVVASCYAVIDSHWLAHLTFLPTRLVAAVRASLRGFVWRLGHPLADSAAATDVDPDPDAVQPVDGIHWYPRMLYAISDYVIPAGWMDTN